MYCGVFSRNYFPIGKRGSHTKGVGLIKMARWHVNDQATSSRDVIRMRKPVKTTFENIISYFIDQYVFLMFRLVTWSSRLRIRVYIAKDIYSHFAILDLLKRIEAQILNLEIDE